MYSALGNRNNRPQSNLNRNPAVWTNLFGDELGWEFGAEEADAEGYVAPVVVYFNT